MLFEAARWTLAGVAVGLLGSWFASRWLNSLLFQVSAQDPLNAGATLLVLDCGQSRGCLDSFAASRKSRADGGIEVRVEPDLGFVIRSRLLVLGVSTTRTTDYRPESVERHINGKRGNEVAKMITLRNVEKYYEHGTTKTWVLRRIDLEVKEGDFLSIMGPSGAGKSTLLHVLGMHDAGWTGEYHLFDQPVHKLKAKERLALSKKYIGFVFQSYHLLDDMTVYENLEIPLSYRDIPKAKRQSIVCDLLDRFQIVGKKDLYPNQLSGGQQQLVAVARAVVASPKLILADEPTGNLHSSQGDEIMQLFARLNQEGTTVIQVTHSDRNASYGRRTIQLADGWMAK